MSNFKGWTTEGLEAAIKTQRAKRLDKAKPHKKSCTCEECNAFAIANLSDEQFKKNCERLMPAKKPAKPKKPKGETANAITANVIRAINMQPRCVAYRINNVGIWDHAKQIHRRGNTQKGIFDISATIKGRAAWFEIKAGYDKPSQDQLIFQQEVIQAGGIAEFVKSTDEFLKLFTTILLDL